MIFRIKAATCCLLISSLWVSAQENKKALTPEDLTKWQRISKSIISDDGNFIAVKREKKRIVSYPPVALAFHPHRSI